MFRHVSQSEQTLGNISEKHIGKHKIFLNLVGNIFASREANFCFRNNVSTGGQTGKHLRKHRESQMFPQQCFLVCPGLKCWRVFTFRAKLESPWVYKEVLEVLEFFMLYVFGYFLKLFHIKNRRKPGLLHQSFCDHSRNFASVSFEGFVRNVWEGTNSVLNTESVPSNISYRSFKTKNLPMQNTYCDHRNFDSVNHPL
jgi:hypothetical protein